MIGTTGSISDIMTPSMTTREHLRGDEAGQGLDLLAGGESVRQLHFTVRKSRYLLKRMLFRVRIQH